VLLYCSRIEIDRSRKRRVQFTKSYRITDGVNETLFCFVSARFEVKSYGRCTGCLPGV
jgi:hypothetical protein